MKECYNAALTADPKAFGQYRITFELARSGNVTGAWMLESNGSPMLGECIVRSYAAVKFPPQTVDGGTFTIPFVLSTSAGPSPGLDCAPDEDGETCEAYALDGQGAKTLAAKDPSRVTFIFRSGASNADVATATRWPVVQQIAIRSPLVDDIRSLAPLKALQLLALTPTQVADVSLVRGLPDLRFLYLPRTADPTPAFDVPTLEGLGLARDLADWTQLARFKHLQALQLSDTQLADLAPLCTLLPRLASLRLIRPALLTEVTPVSSLTELVRLSLVDSRVTSLAPLSSLTKLRALDLTRSPVTDLSPLAKHTGLVEVRLGGTKVTQLWPLLASAASLKQLVVPKAIPEDALATFRSKNPTLKIARE